MERNQICCRVGSLSCYIYNNLTFPVKSICKTEAEQAFLKLWHKSLTNNLIYEITSEDWGGGGIFALVLDKTPGFFE
jgi:hypothetical protein